MHATQKLLLARIQRPVGPGDVEQRGQHLLQHAAIVGEGLRQLRGIGFERVGAVARLVEQPPDAAGRGRGNAEIPLEGVDFQPRHRPVALASLAASTVTVMAKTSSRRPSMPATRAGLDGVALHERAADAFDRAGVGGMPKRGADDRAVRAADKEAGRAADDLTPVSHSDDVITSDPTGAKHERFGSGCQQGWVLQRGVLPGNRIGDRGFQAVGALPFMRRTRVLARRDLVDAPVDLQPMVVRVAELHRDLHAGPPAAIEIDRHIVLAQMGAGADHVVQRGDLERQVMQAAAGRVVLRSP